MQYLKKSPKKIKKKLYISEKGQISIMIGVMMMTFIFFFAFVINTGMLVNAKINLQNAADLAAYAGAAVQARQLTQISYLNYEMRRQWKKFLFRLYVLGNMSQDSFQDAQGQTGTMNYYPNRSNVSNDYHSPSTCIVFSAVDNFCHLDTLPKITIPPATFLDSVSDALRDQLTTIEHIRQKNCKGMGLTNLMVNLYWLYNTDPEMKNFGDSTISGFSQEEINTLKLVEGMTTGLGIVPRELILQYRIKTLTSYVNAQVQSNLTQSTVNGLLNTADPSYYERTIQAFYSAYYTLGNHTYPGGSITLDELLPGDSDNAMLLELTTIRQVFDTFSINSIIDSPAADGSGDCKNMINPISVTSGLPVGVVKKANTLTYYAIRLKAKARLLFSPFGEMELKAYAAAQPFGSRIGPDLQDNSFGYSGGPTQIHSIPGDTAAGLNTASFIPNLPVKEDDPMTPSASSGWNTKEVMTLMYASLRSASASSSVIDSSSIERAYRLAMAPNPWEANRYNIINDVGVDWFVRNFGSNERAAFWAPVFPPGKSSHTIQDQLKSDLQALFSENASSASVGNSGSSSGRGNPTAAAVQDSVFHGLSTYMGTLTSGDGEDQEGMNLVKISNPFHYDDGTPIIGDESLIMTNPTLFKSSWNSVNDQELRRDGRVGYSVKLVSFDSLTSHKMTTDGSTTWNNDLSQDPEAQSDIPFIKH